MKNGEIFKEIFLLRKRRAFLEKIFRAKNHFTQDSDELAAINKKIEELRALLEKQKNN